MAEFKVIPKGESKQSRLDRAKAAPKRRGYIEVDPQDIEVALAWMTDEINYVQVSQVYNNITSSTVYIKLARALREAYKQGILKLEIQ